MKKAWLGMAACVAACGILAGCEEAEDVRGLTVEPSFVDLYSGASNTTQTLTVSSNGLGALSLPLEWSVSNPGLGTIGNAGGYSASYVRTSGAHGDNTILVKDQYGAEGVATVRQ